MIISKLVTLISRQKNDLRLKRFKRVHTPSPISPEIRLSPCSSWNKTEPVGILQQCEPLITWCLLVGFLHLSLSLFTLAFMFSY